ncbi:MAG: transcriptional regulator [Burkholderiaceae bacterium]|nr:transcriptional regulator [Microbacteriaceae bacterium]
MPDVDPVILDPVIHAAARLRITATLASIPVGDRIVFPRLQELLDMTAGNLSTHLRKLEDAKYVTVTKSHQGRSPVTYLELSTRGRRAFEDYTDALRALLGEHS